MNSEPWPKWLSREDYIERYMNELGVGWGTVAKYIAHRKVKKMRRGKDRFGRPVASTDHYVWPRRSGPQIAIRNVPPDIKPMITRASCRECGKPAYVGGNNYIGADGICARCKRKRPRLVGELVDLAGSELAMSEHRYETVGDFAFDRSHTLLGEKRELRIAAHAARIEAAGLCGDGEDWLDED